MAVKDGSRLVNQLAAVLVACSTLLQHASALCYYPNGDEANDQPCFPTQSDSGCCGPGYDCTPQGLCNRVGTDFTNLVRGSCTDQSWKSSECPQFCVGPPSSNPFGANNLGGGQNLWECDDPTFYYCSAEVEDSSCSQGGNFLVGNVTNIGPPPGYQSSGIYSTSYATSTLISTETYVSSSAGQAPVTITQIVTSTAQPSAATTGEAGFTPAGAGAQNTGGPTPTPQSSSSGSNAAAIGGGVGGGIAALLILAIIAFLLWRRHSKKKKLDQSQTYQAEHGAATTPYSDSNAMQSAVPTSYSSPGQHSPFVPGQAYAPSAADKSSGRTTHASPVPPMSSQHTGATQHSELDSQPAARRVAPAELPGNEPWREF